MVCLGKIWSLFLTMGMLGVGAIGNALDLAKPCRALALPVAGATARIFFLIATSGTGTKNNNNKNHSLKASTFLSPWISFFSATLCLTPGVPSQAKCFPLFYCFLFPVYPENSKSIFFLLAFLSFPILPYLG